MIGWLVGRNSLFVCLFVGWLVVCSLVGPLVSWLSGSWFVCLLAGWVVFGWLVS